MRFLSFVLTALALTLPAVAAPLSDGSIPQTATSGTPPPSLESSIPQGSASGTTPSSNSPGTTNAGPTKFIVGLKDGASKSDVLGILGASAQSTEVDLNIINGFTGTFDAATADALRNSASVNFVEADGIMRTTATQKDAPWGIARIATKDKLSEQDDTKLDFSFDFDDSAGSGIDVYVVDTGIRTTHEQFEGRAKWGGTFCKHCPDIDDVGHGTHVSGTIAGKQFGVAKKANLIAVKVINQKGEGLNSETVAGLNFVSDAVKKSGNPSIVSLSVVGGPSDAIDHAANSLARAGVHVIVAAGNDGVDVSNESPARAQGAFAVGATDITDTMASFSNFGPQLGAFAPGVNITSAFNTDDKATATFSGTSMACPHVSGLVAYILGLEKKSISPVDMRKRLQDLAVKNKLASVPKGTGNELAQLPGPQK